MKRKVTRKPKPTRKPAAYSPPQVGEQSKEAAMVAAIAPALGLKLDSAWEAGVIFNLQLLLRHAALVDEFPLPDDAEPAPIFYA
jgi:hypothetical protein